MEVSERMTEDRAIALSDLELAIRLYDALGRLDVEADASQAVTDSYFLVGEMIERFAPDVARAETLHVFKDDDDPNNLLDALNGIRERQAARALRDALGSETENRG